MLHSIIPEYSLVKYILVFLHKISLSQSICLLFLPRSVSQIADTASLNLHSRFY